MKIEALEGQNIEELSMIEVAHAILEQNGKEMAFAEILNAVQDYLKSLIMKSKLQLHVLHRNEYRWKLYSIRK